MSNQCIDQVGGIEQQQHDGDAEADLLIRDPHCARQGLGALRCVEDGRQEQCDDQQDEHGRELAGIHAVEALLLPPQPADQHGKAEPKQGCSEDRASDLRLHHFDLTAG